MASIRIAVSYLEKYKNHVTAVMPHVAAAFQPFGVALQTEWGYPLNRDPVDETGWHEVITFLTNKSAAAAPQRLAHVVFAEAPPGFDRNINGQLLNRGRGVCAVFLAADLFQVPTPFNGVDRLVQVVIHEVAHLFNLTHGDSYASGGYADAVMPAALRHKQTPAVAWSSAVADAANRHEPGVVAPNPILTYPFGVTCRACLRAAASDPQWWPWGAPFRGDFDVPSEIQDSSLRLRIRNLARGRRVEARHGIDFTLEISNEGSEEVQIPAHIGPEFGTLLVSSSIAGKKEEHGFHADSYRCSDAVVGLPARATILRSFCLVPTEDNAFLAGPGRHTVTIRLSRPNEGRSTLLGAVAFDVDTEPGTTSERCVSVASSLIGAVRGRNELPTRRAFKSLSELEDDSPLTHQARYKLAMLHSGAERRTLLKDCMKARVPIAVRHRACKQWMLDELRAGRMKSGPTKALLKAFSRPEDTELLESLKRMSDGWNALKQD